MEPPNNSRKFPMTVIIYFRNLSKNPTKLVKIQEELLERGQKFSKYWRKSPVIASGIQDNQHVMSNFHEEGKVKMKFFSARCGGK